MDDLKFNTHAFVNPSTIEEYIALLDEAIRMLDDLEEELDRLFSNKSDC